MRQIVVLACVPLMAVAAVAGSPVTDSEARILAYLCGRVVGPPGMV